MPYKYIDPVTGNTVYSDQPPPVAAGMRRRTEQFKNRNAPGQIVYFTPETDEDRAKDAADAEQARRVAEGEAELAERVALYKEEAELERLLELSEQEGFMEAVIEGGFGEEVAAMARSGDYGGVATTLLIGQGEGMLMDKAVDLVLRKFKSIYQAGKGLLNARKILAAKNALRKKLAERLEKIRERLLGKRKGTKVERGQPNGKANDPCADCPAGLGIGFPVNPLRGIKYLTGDADLDFVLDGPMPFRWQRSYLSSNGDVGALGQGWALPIAYRIEVGPSAVTVIDTQGRRIRFLPLEVGTSFYSVYERSTLARIAQDAYRWTDSSGIQLLFGPAGDAATAEAVAAPSATNTATLHLHRFSDANGNFVRVHRTPDGQPYLIDNNVGRRVGLIYSPPGSAGARLTHAVELLGEPQPDGQFPADQQRWLVEYRYSEDGDLREVVDGAGEVVRSFTWDRHILTSHGEPGGVTASYTWDRLAPDGKVVECAASTGERWRFAYAPGHTRVTDISGRVTEYFSDRDHQLVCTIAPDGAVTRVERNAVGQAVVFRDAANRATEITYDDWGNAAAVEHPDGAVERFERDTTTGRLLSSTDPLDRVTRYEYDAKGNLTRVTAPDGASTAYEHNAWGQVTAVLDARGGRSIIDYDAQGRVIAVSDCLGQPTRYRYDSAGNLAAIEDALGGVTSFSYRYINRRYRLVERRLADGGVERLAYDRLGRLIAHHDVLGRATRYELDAVGRPLARENSSGSALRYGYDVHGRLVALTNENGAVYRFAWDAADRLVAEQGFDGRRRDYGYDRAGELLHLVDGVPQGADLLAPGAPGLLRTRYQRDARGRLTDKLSAKRGDDGAIKVRHARYRYDLAGKMVQARNEHARVDLHYSLAGQLAREVVRTREGQTTALAHEHDGMGNRLHTTLPDGRILRYSLYGSGHVDRIELDGATVAAFERDRLHRETVRSQGPLSTFFEWDAVGRLLSSHTKASAASPTRQPNTAPGLGGAPWGAYETARQYRYDAGGQLLSLEDARRGSARYAYDAIGRIAAAQFGSIAEAFAFDPAGNLLDATAASPAPPSADGGRAWSEEDWETLVRRHIDRPEFNLLQTDEERSTDPSGWAVQRSNRLATHQEHRYRYDAWGNCVEKRSGTGERRAFEWDAEHRLEHARIETVAGAEEWRYDYDPFGRRIAKHQWRPQNASARSRGRRARRFRDGGRPEASTHFVWDGNRLLTESADGRVSLHVYEASGFVPLALVRSSLERSSSEAPADAVAVTSLPLEWQSLQERHPEEWAAALKRQRRLQERLNRQLPQPTESAPVGAATTEVFHVHTDQLGTPCELTDEHGHLVWTADYKAWGRVLSLQTPPRRVVRPVVNAVVQQWEEQVDPVEQNLRFQGQYFDRETGLHYNRFRHYDPDVGRFISQDPVGLLGGSNLYIYVDNPTDAVDPLGLAPTAFKLTGRTLCIVDKFPAGSAESLELQDFTKRWNTQIQNQGGSMTRRKLTALEQAESRKWKDSMRCHCGPGRVAGHVPDASAGGPAVPLDWMAQLEATNSYVGGIVRHLPLGYTYDTVKLATSLGGC